MILFKTLRWKNLLSTGNYFSEIKLNGNANTLVIGTNGSGKSTMLDALCFALFGKPKGEAELVHGAKYMTAFGLALRSFTPCQI